jgi:hypothetical protein
VIEPMLAPKAPARTGGIGLSSAARTTIPTNEIVARTPTRLSRTTRNHAYSSPDIGDTLPILRSVRATRHGACDRKQAVAELASRVIQRLAPVKICVPTTVIANISSKMSGPMSSYSRITGTPAG